ncbi:DUF4352 domain-containing protein [Gottfriedia sp. NPDC056225]|uniref:DUF4352 domain-containing protein n=1 Tax=Gottfriedia sp. NPDC056225 TaxID=3345751 RepID=UPI0035DA65A1
MIISLASGGDNTKTSTTAKTEQKSNKPLSNTGVSSDVTIKVNGIESKNRIGGAYTKEIAQGVFKVVSLSITNGQKDAITLDANSFKLIDDKGREFTYSTSGQTALEIADNSLSDFFLKQLNPGLTQNGKIVFDLPKDAKGLKLQARGGFTGDDILLKAE